MSENIELIYDEDEAIKFILKNLPKELQAKCTKDEVEYVLDLVYEMYEENGYLDENSTEEVLIDEEEVLKYVLKHLKEEKNFDLDAEEVRYILDGEFKYCQSIGIFTDEK